MTSLALAMTSRLAIENGQQEYFVLEAFQRASLQDNPLPRSVKSFLLSVLIGFSEKLE